MACVGQISRLKKLNVPITFSNKYRRLIKINCKILYYLIGAPTGSNMLRPITMVSMT